MATIFHKFIEVSASKPAQAENFIQFAFMEHQIRKNYKQLKDSKGVTKPSQDFVDYWKEIGNGGRQEQVSVYFRWIELLEKALSNYNHRQIEDKEAQLYVRKSIISKWDQRKVKLSGLTMFIFSKKLKEFPLKCFCIRKSKNKDHFSWVMEVVMQIDDSKFKSFHLGSNNVNEYHEWYKQVESRIDLARIQYFKQCMGSDVKLKVIPSFNTKEQKQEKPKEALIKIQPIAMNINHPPDPRPRTKTLTQLVIDKQLKHIQDQDGLDVIQDNQAPQISQQEIHPNVFLKIFPDKQLTQFSQNPTTGTLLQCEKQYRLYQIEGVIKIFITMNYSSPVVFRAISESHRNWNPQINTFNIKNKISSQNSVLIYQKDKSKGFLYRQRDYLFLRHCFTESQDKKQRIFMIQKSFDSIHSPPFMSVSRGQKQLIWCVMGDKNQKECLLIVEGIIKGGGYMNANEDKQTTIKHFKLLLQLDNYLKQIEYSNTQKDGYLFKQKWLVSFKPQPADQFYSPRQIQSQQFQSAKMEQLVKKEENIQKVQKEDKQQKQNQSRLYGTPQKQNQSAFNDFIKHTSQQHFAKIQSIVINPNYTVSAEELNHQYTPPAFNADKSIIIPNKYLNKHHDIEPRPKGKQVIAQKIRGHHLWKGEWAVAESGGLSYIDQEKMRQQKKVLTFIIKRIGKNILTGKGILNVSLPVDIFCRQSNIQRLAMSFGYCPLFLQKVVQASLFDQLKAVICSIMGSSLIYITMEKPFNPILGETYQCWIDGCPIYFEQISHHPPVASYLMKGRGYQVYGSVEAKMDLSINSGTGINQGIFTIKFDNGRKFYFTTPAGQLSGLTYGDRKLVFVEKTYFWQFEEGIFLQIIYNPLSKQSRFFGSGKTYVGEERLGDYFEGIVRKYKPEDLRQFLTPKKNDTRKNMNIPRSLPPQQAISEHQKVHGRWTKYFYFGEQKIFDVDNCDYLKCFDERYPLPSHSNFREDVVYRRLNQFVLSQEWKENLQVKQRKDRKLRQDYRKKSK